MQFTLAPGASSPLKHMYGRWQIHPVEHPAPDAPRDVSFTSNDLDESNISNECSSSCLVTLHQTFIPPPLPRLLFPSFARVATKQVRRTFEDLAMEVTRMRNQNGTLAPYMSACMKEFGHGSGADPLSVLSALEEASTTSTSRSSMDLKSRRDISVASRVSSGSSMLSNCLVEPVSYPLVAELEDDDPSALPEVHNASAHIKEQNQISGIYLITDAFDDLITAAFRYLHLDVGLEDDLPDPWFVIA
jgi:hypothetical protein